MVSPALWARIASTVFFSGGQGHSGDRVKLGSEKGRTPALVARSKLCMKHRGTHMFHVRRVIRHGGIIFRVRWFLNGGGSLTQTRRIGNYFARFFSRVYLGHGIFHPVALSYFSKDQLLGEVLSFQIEEPHKKRGCMSTVACVVSDTEGSRFFADVKLTFRLLCPMTLCALISCNSRFSEIAVSYFFWPEFDRFHSFLFFPRISHLPRARIRR